MNDTTFGGKPIHFNVLANLIVQGANFLLPLALLPFLAHSLGSEAFGLYVMVFTITNYAAIAVEWGFNIGGARLIASNRLDTKFVKITFWKVTYAKILLFLVCSSILSVFAIFYGENLGGGIVYIGLLHLVGTALYPDWILLGLERNVNLTLSTLSGRLLQLVLTILFIHDPQDVGMAIGIWASSTMLCALFAILPLTKIIGIEPVPFNFKDVCRTIVENSSFFLVRSAVTLYSSSGVLLVGAAYGKAQAGTYGAADRLARAGLAFIGQIGNAAIPRINALSKYDPDRMPSLILRMALLQILLGVAFATLILFGAEMIVNLMFGPSFANAASYLRVLSVLPILVVLGNILGVQIMVPLGLERDLALISLATLPVFAIALYSMTQLFSVLGAPFATLIAEVFSLSFQAAVIFFRRRSFVYSFFRLAVRSE